MTSGITVPTGHEPVASLPLPAHEFASLWHRWDFIEADYLPASTHPEWRRIKAFPLDPRPLIRRLRDPGTLIGVSFGKLTSYCMVDIDWGSRYHPHRYPSGYGELVRVFEEMGLVEPLVVTSSDSGGLHLYYPLPVPVSSFRLGHVLKSLCEKEGLTVAPGQLELFPNAKRYSATDIVLYQAHRLPLQVGSAVLDKDGAVVGNSFDLFMTQWKRAAARQDSELFLEQFKGCSVVIPFPKVRVSERGAKLQADDKARIELGWTGSGQTNELLRVIARYGRIWEGLSDDDLARYIERIAIELPGYREFCGHQSDITKRCKEWAASTTCRYYPYGEQQKGVGKVKQPSNEEREQAAIARIEAAMLEFTNAETLEVGITARCNQLTSRGISKETLYKHKDLWHPNYLHQMGESQATEAIQEIEAPITDPPLRSVGLSEPVLSLPKKEFTEQTIGESEGETLLSRVKAAAGKWWSKTLERVVKAADPARVVQALDAYFEQLARISIKNPGAWLYQAIVEGFGPNSEKGRGAADRSEFNEWFEAARVSGLALATEPGRDGEIWVHLRCGQKRNWQELRQEYPVEKLKARESGYYADRQPVEFEEPESRGGDNGDHPAPVPDFIKKWIAEEKAKRRSAAFGL